jgi:hypothetical protein
MPADEPAAASDDNRHVFVDLHATSQRITV